MKYHGDLVGIGREASGYYKRTNGGSCTPYPYCFVCGREIKSGAKSVWVMQDHNRGETVDYDESADPDVYSCYQVGSACAKKYLKGVVLVPGGL